MRTQVEDAESLAPPQGVGAASGGVRAHLGEDQGPGGEVHPQRPHRDEGGVQEGKRDKVGDVLFIDQNSCCCNQLECYKSCLLKVQLL